MTNINLYNHYLEADPCWYNRNKYVMNNVENFENFNKFSFKWQVTLFDTIERQKNRIKLIELIFERENNSLNYKFNLTFHLIG